MKRLSFLSAVVVLAAGAVACTSNGKSEVVPSRAAAETAKTPAPAKSDATARPAEAEPTEKTVANNGIPPGDGPLLATFHTSMGKIVVKLFEKEAPQTVENFVGLATGNKEWKHPRSGETVKGRPLYDGTSFHRVIQDFMVQGGDPLSNPVDGDLNRAGTGGPGYRFGDEFASGLRFDRPGLLAMANAGPNTNGSQFFITEVPTPHLNNRHTIFGEVIEGFELVPKITRVRKGPGDRPIEPVLLEKVEITRGQ